MKLCSICRGFAKTVTLAHRLQQKHAPTLTAFSRTLSARTTAPLSSADGRPPRRVLLSTSQDIFENLALEEWLYHQLDLSQRDYLLMWRNGPAVVIGRHQNPWTECDVQQAYQSGIPVVRRISGGGTVFHDEGNLNLSFLMDRRRYNRKGNLELIVEALTSKWPTLELDINCRDDIVLDGLYKVSGTAAKLGGNRTFHHFTLVFSVNKDVLSSILHSPLVDVDSKATQSVRSRVKNLSEVAPDMTFDSLVQVIGQRFLQADESKIEPVYAGNEDRFPGVGDIQQRMRSWQWTFAKTPPFTVQRTFTRSAQDSTAACDKHYLKVVMDVEKGEIRSVSLTLKARLRDSGREVQLPFRLLDLVCVAGPQLQGRQLSKMWEQCWTRVGEEKGAEDYELLRWGLECVTECLPVGYEQELVHRHASLPL